ncbi:hypothetical protein DOX58_11760 [Cronobacter sakazakii]|nr:hypothetical protein [Cronobacter sakazakii]
MQRQAMGVALHIVLLPFLNYCIAQLIRTMPTCLSRLFFACVLPSAFWHTRAALFPSVTYLLRLGYLPCKEEATMQHLYQTRMSDPVPIDPVPVPDPIPTPQPVPDPPSPDPRPIDDPPPHMR